MWLAARSTSQTFVPVRGVQTHAYIACSSLCVGLLAGIASLARRSVWAVPERVVEREAALACIKAVARLGSWVASHTGIAGGRYMRVAAAVRTRLAVRAIVERLRAGHALNTFNTVVAVTTKDNARIAVALVVLGLRTCRASRATAAAAVLSRTAVLT